MELNSNPKPIRNSNFIYSENLITSKLKIIKIINTTNVPEDRSEQKPLPEEVLKNPDTAMIPDKPDVMCALIASICTIADKYTSNFIKYLTRLDKEDRAEYSILGLKIALGKYSPETVSAVGKEYVDLTLKIHKYTK